MSSQGARLRAFVVGASAVAATLSALPAVAEPPPARLVLQPYPVLFTANRVEIRPY